MYVYSPDFMYASNFKIFLFQAPFNRLLRKHKTEAQKKHVGRF